MDVILGEVAVHVETLQTLEAVSQVSTSKATNTTQLPDTDQLSAWALGYMQNKNVNALQVALRQMWRVKSKGKWSLKDKYKEIK